MSLRRVLLVYLASGAASGYDIVKGFQKTYGHLWNATWQQVYRDLNKLHEDGLVTQEVIPGGNRPARKVYRLNDEGRAELDRFIREPAKPPRVNDAFLVKIASAHLFDAGPLLDELRVQRGRYRAYVTSLERYDAFFAALTPDVQEQVHGAWFSLRRGLDITRSWLTWADEVEAWLIRRQQAAPAQALTADVVRDFAPDSVALFALDEPEPEPDAAPKKKPSAKPAGARKKSAG